MVAPDWWAMTPEIGPGYIQVDSDFVVIFARERTPKVQNTTLFRYHLHWICPNMNSTEQIGLLPKDPVISLKAESKMLWSRNNVHDDINIILKFNSMIPDQFEIKEEDEVPLENVRLPHDFELPLPCALRPTANFVRYPYHSHRHWENTTSKRTTG
ncbi:hypothetical protein CPB84DRAFT_1413144 [Gymnopilus junonius]|uniref:Uncharacterized protein n=1 Tax=Gymnopilus junonius TaxID=109634 RepID=A0A9P5TL90_GYMJU|nr:hypothetical protein CPB84DRAFT_1413144 [Gymnopilus junonius]